MSSENLKIKVPRLGKNRHGVYFVRSSALDSAGRRRVRQQSLHTKDPQLARVLALKFCLSLAEGLSMSDFRDRIAPYGINLSTGEAHAKDAADHARMMQAIQKLIEAQAALHANARLVPPQVASGTATPALAVPIGNRHGKLLSAAFGAHLEEEARRLASEQTVKEKRILFNEFIDCFGDVPINDITKAEITERWRRVEYARPNKKIAGAKVSGARLEKRRGYLSKFFEWAYAAGIYDRDNPAKQPMATKSEIKAQRQSYAEFTADDLEKLFGPEFSKAMDKPDWYWLPLMALLSGARLNELADLRVENFSEIEGIKVFEIRKGKNSSSKRIVPIHRHLLELGLWDYVQALKIREDQFLFPHRPATNKAKDAGREKSTGRQWGVWVSKCGISDKRKVFHSFRSTAITDLHNAGAGHASIRAGVGHAAVGVSGAHGGYVRGVQLQNLQETIEKLVHPSVDFAKLRLEDPTFSVFFNAERAKANDPRRLAAMESQARHEAAKAALGSRKRA